jgi:hypothetical protein
MDIAKNSETRRKSKQTKKNRKTSKHAKSAKKSKRQLLNTGNQTDETALGNHANNALRNIETIRLLTNKP